MQILNSLLQELGISKVKLSKYLGVSRQMVYNYLVLDSLDKWPKEKRLLLLQLLDIKDLDEKYLMEKMNDTEYLLGIEQRLNQALKSNVDFDNFFDVSELSKENKDILINLINIIRDLLLEDDSNNQNAKSMKYLYYLLQSFENIPEIKFVFAYMAKINTFIKEDEFVYDESKQFIFECILYSALNLYSNGGELSKNKMLEIRHRLIKDIEQKKEEKLSRTQQLFTIKDQALKELGYADFNDMNANEVIEKIVEIESRKV